MVGWLPHVTTTLPKVQSEGFGVGFGSFYDLSEVLFLSTYQPSSDNYWVAMVVLGSVTMIVSGPAYYFISKRYFYDQCGEYKSGARRSSAGQVVADDDEDDRHEVSLAPDRLIHSDDTRGCCHA